MDPILLVLVFIITSILILAPYIGITQLQSKFKRQHLDYRLKIITKQSTSAVANKNASKNLKKFTPGKLSIGKILLFIFLPLPPLLVMFLSSSIYSALMSAFLYFVLIFAGYYMVVKLKEKRFKKAFINDLPNSVDLIIRSLRAGRTITDSIKISCL